MRQITTNTELLQMFDLIEVNNNTLTPKLGTYILVKTEEYGANKSLSSIVVLGKDVDDFEKTLQSSPEYKEYIRYRLSKFIDNPSKQNFKETKVIVWVDIDHPLPLEELAKECNDLQYPPNILKRTNKGWHLIWLSEYSITDKVLLEEIEEKFGILLRSNSYFSSVIDKIGNIMSATRPIYPDLPCYVLKEEPYNALDLYERIKEMYIPIANFQDRQANMISPNDLSVNLVKSAVDLCSIAKVLMNSFEDHDYREWFNVSFFFALRDLLGDKDAKQEWLAKSRLYYKYGTSGNNDKNTLNQLEYTKNFIVKDKHAWVLPSCEFIRTHARPERELSKACELCPARKINHVYRFLLKNNEEETLSDTIFIENGFVYKRAVVSKKGSEPIETITKVCKAITPLVIIRKAPSYKANSIEYLKYQYNNETYYARISRTSGGELSLKEFSFVSIHENNYKAFREYIEIIIQRLREQGRVQNVPFLGYEEEKAIVVNKHISYADAIVYLTQDFNLKVFNGVINVPELYIPHSKGSVDEYLKGVEKLLKLRDPLILSAVGHELVMFSKDILDTAGFQPLNIIQIWRGAQGIGKTQRLILANRLFTNGFASFKSTTLAKFQNDYHFIKIPLIFDEVVLSSPNDVEKFKDMIYHIANMLGKQDAEKVLPPLKSPVIMAGERVNLYRMEKLLTTGAARRMMIVDIGEVYKFEITPKIAEVSRILSQNFGHADVIQSFFFKNAEKYNQQFDSMLEKVSTFLEQEAGFSPRYYTDLFRHITQILLNLRFLALMTDPYAFTEEDEDELLRFYQNTLRNSSELLGTVNDESVYADIENAIQRFTYTFKEEKTFKGSLPTLLAKAGVTYTSKLSPDIIKVLVAKYYKNNRAWIGISNLFIYFDGAHSFPTVDREIKRITENLFYMKNSKVKEWFKNYDNLFYLSTLVREGFQEEFLRKICKELDVDFTTYDESNAKQKFI